MYTIGEVSKMVGLPISTLRYYNKEGLFPEIKRVNGIRQFDEKEIDALHIIECLKESGLDIAAIKQFIDWCAGGKETYRQRLELFLRQREEVLKQMKKIQDVLDTLNYKCWYYENAIQDGNEERVSKFTKDNYKL